MVVHVKPQTPAVETVRLLDKSVGLDGVIVIHSEYLGPATGGCRLWDYRDVADMFDDAQRLAACMSYKNAMAGLPMGGGAAVLRRPDGPFDREALFRAFGRAVEELRGRYITAEDVGSTMDDMAHVAQETRYVAGLGQKSGSALAGGDPSPWTAEGVYASIVAAAKFAFQSDLSGLTVGVQGTGKVGGELCRRLADAGAKLVISDEAPGRRDRLGAILKARIVAAEKLAAQPMDIFVPCAVGGVLNDDSVAALQAKIVCGAANNQLAHSGVADLLQEKGIAYVPDYVANAGGVISVAAEYAREDSTVVAQRVGQIGPRVTALLEQAKARNVSPAHVADAMAEQQMVLASRVAA
jgi:leucine dehydrogenase